MTTERERFEAWWRASKYTQVVIPKDGWEQIAWDGWQAALAQPAQPDPRAAGFWLAISAAVATYEQQMGIAAPQPAQPVDGMILVVDDGSVAPSHRGRAVAPIGNSCCR